MSESCNRLNANLKLQGHPCLHCNNELALGDAAAQCNACSGIHHGPCWDGVGGCATHGCINAPLKRLDDAPRMEAKVGHISCPACSSEILATESICPYCNSICSADGVYNGPQENAPGAVASLVFGIIGLFVCGIIFGIVAISKSSTAKQNIALDPRYNGEGLATAGMVLGIIDLVFFVIGMLIVLG